MNFKVNSSLTLDDASDEIITKCIADNTFENPKYISNVAAGRSNWKTDPTLTTYRNEGETLVLPRGYMQDLLEILRLNETKYELIDERVLSSCEYPDKLIGVTLRSYQEKALDEVMKCDQGIIVSPTGSGKSLIGLETIRRRGQKALIIVHRGELAKQWIDIISERLGIKAGFIGDGQWNVGKEITVAMVQTLSSKKAKAEILYDAFGLVLLDEGHHVPASTFFCVISKFSAQFIYSLTATPQRRDGLEQLIYKAIGPVLSTISKSEVEDMGATVPATVISIQTDFNPGMISSWNDYLHALSYDPERNKLIIDLAIAAEGSTLILVDRVNHAEQLSSMLKSRNIDHVIAHGKINKNDKNNVIDRIKSTNLTIGTTSLLGEGLDVSVWETLIMGAPISSEIKLIQAIGRIVRPNIGKEKAFVYDLKDNCVFSWSSFKKRLEIYKKNKIRVEFTNKKTARTNHAA